MLPNRSMRWYTDAGHKRLVRQSHRIDPDRDRARAAHPARDARSRGDPNRSFVGVPKGPTICSSLLSRNNPERAFTFARSATFTPPEADLYDGNSSVASPARSGSITRVSERDRTRRRATPAECITIHHNPMHPAMVAGTGRIETIHHATMQTKRSDDQERTATNDPLAPSRGGVAA